jgi:hypothetical protein
VIVCTSSEVRIEHWSAAAAICKFVANRANANNIAKSLLIVLSKTTTLMRALELSQSTLARSRNASITIRIWHIATNRCVLPRMGERPSLRPARMTLTGLSPAPAWVRGSDH